MTTPPPDRPADPGDREPAEASPPAQSADPYSQPPPTAQSPDWSDQQRADQPPPGYQPAPAPSWPAETPRTKPAPPPSILTAVRLMYVGAVLGAIGFLLTLLTQGSIREQIEESTPGLTAEQVDTAVSVSIGVAVLFGLVGVLLWVWMAESNRRGKSWARIVATVLGGLNVATTLFSLFTARSTLLNTVFSVVSAALAAVIIYYLYRPDSNAYYETVSG